MRTWCWVIICKVKLLPSSLLPASDSLLTAFPVLLAPLQRLPKPRTSLTPPPTTPPGALSVFWPGPRVAHLDTGAATLYKQLALGPQGRLPTRPNLATGLNLSPGPVSKSKNFSLG